MSLVPLERVEAIRVAAKRIEVRDTLHGYQLCSPCTSAVRKAAAGVCKQLRLCVVCKAAVLARLRADRRGP